MEPALPPVRAVPLDLVDWEDRRFAIEGFLPSPEVEASLSRFGLLTLPWVVRTEGEKVTIVDGFKRMRCLREWGHGPVPCVVFPTDTDLDELWVKRVEARLFGPPMNVAEKAQIVSRLATRPIERDLMKRFLDVLGLPHRPEILNKWKRLAETGTDLLEAAARGGIHERAALELARWPENPEDRNELILMIEQLRCSASIQVEIIERFQDISMTRAQPVRDLLHSSEAQSVLGHPDWNHREKTQALREWLDGLRLPRLKARERHFAEQIGRTPPPMGVNLVPPPFFEGDRWRLDVTFTGAEQLRYLLEQVSSWSFAEGFGELMAPRPEPPSGGASSNRTTASD